MGPPKYGKCKQDMEIQMSGNYFGHFLLTRELLPALKKAEKARIVNLSSLAHISAYLKSTGWTGYKQGFDFEYVNDPSFYSPWWNYGQVLFLVD